LWRCLIEIDCVTLHTLYYMKTIISLVRTALVLQLSLFSLLSFAQTIDILRPVTDKSAERIIGEELRVFGLLEVDAEAYSQLQATAPDNWDLTLPATPGVAPALTLQLRRNNFLRSDFRLRRSSDGGVVPQPDLGRHYVGELTGEAGSRVALSLLEGELTATITYADGRRLSLGKVQNQPDKSSAVTYLLFPDAQLAERQELDCTTADSGIPYKADELTYAGAGAKTTVGCVDVFFEIDYDIFFDKGSVTAAAQHLAANFNEVSFLYDEIGVSLNISEILVWDEISPYAGTSSSALLTQFQSYRTSFNGDLAQLVSYQASGGIAVLDGLCHPFNAARMSFSSIHPNFRVVPIYSWTTMVIAHELGHLLGSQHTHACVWNGNDTAIDGCAGLTEGFCGTPGIPAQGGTIMSYCHLRPQGINFQFGFGPQPSAVIANRVAAAQGCVQATCNIDGGGGGDNNDGDAGSGPSVCDQQTVFVKLVLDDFGMETTWSIKTETGTVLASGGPYPKKKKGLVIRDTLCVVDGCYNFEIADADGDGLCCDYGPGRYELTDTTGNVLVAYTAFDTLAVADFCLPYVKPNDDDDDVGTACPIIDFVENPVISYGTNQDAGTATILEGNKGILIKDNAWKAIAINYTVTPDTWISFWFRSEKKGEVHGIGMDNNAVLSSNLTFRLHGTQVWGIGDYANYPDDGAWKFYQIPIGAFYTLQAKYLFFTADHDVGSRDGNSMFRDVSISEGIPCGRAELPTTLPFPTPVPESEMEITPNPASDEINVRLPKATRNTGYRVLDLNGRTVKAGTLGKSGGSIPVRDLPNGTYVFRAEDGVSRRFVVAR
jgi:hypothetical protein